MRDQAVRLGPGVRVSYDGDAVEVVELSGTRVTVRNDRTGQFAVMALTRLVSNCRALQAVDKTSQGDGSGDSIAVTLAGLNREERAEVAERAAHVREVLTGYKAGHPEAAAPGEPRAEYGPDVPLWSRYRAKADELGIGHRTIRRWAADYRRDGEAGLVDSRTLRGRETRVDARWDDAVRSVLAEGVAESTPTRSAVLARVSARLDETFGPGVVARPSTATAYRRLAALTKGTNAVNGSANARRSIADRPQGTFGRLRATRPGEYVVLDTQDLDVFALEEVTCRWVRAQLTIAQDLSTRCIVGLRVTPVSTKAVDVAGVLYQAVVPQPAPASWPERACWPYHGLPQQLVFDETARLVAPVCAPETLVVDNGKVFVSAHVLSVCTRLGISIQPAQPYKPTDKPTCERFFKTLREGLIQHLPAYKGPDVYSRGERVEDDAILFIHELEDVIREWVAVVYHRAKHDGLTVPEWPTVALSPVEMFAAGIARAGSLRIPATPELAYEFLPVAARTIQHYGVDVNGLRYNGPALDAYRNSASPYGGTLAGKWPIRVNPDDVRYVYFQDPADDRWHRLAWEHEPGLSTPFSADAAAYARRLAAGKGLAADPVRELATLLARWKDGIIAGQRERRMAARLVGQYTALPLAAEPSDPSSAQPSAPGSPPPAGGEGDGDDKDERLLQIVSDDDAADLTDNDGDEDFYADAFEVLT
jgi:putative transposase